ncbi:MAG: hypothetical protein QNJ40_08140 [Xanthomonadales bacterium]|nr:hypothetical protein [Xanthomonadales bacterium]
MSWFNKLHNRKTPPGLERVIFRKLPMLTLGGTLIPFFVAMGTRLWPPAGTSAEIAKHITTVDITAIATVITVWTALFTVAIGCVLVMVMKGPAYVADAYSMEKPDKPERESDRS